MGWNLAYVREKPTFQWGSNSDPLGPQTRALAHWTIDFPLKTYPRGNVYYNPSPHRTKSPSEYPPQDQIDSPPHTPCDLEKVLENPSSETVKDTTQKDPFPRFWSGQTGDIPNKSKRRHRWLIRKHKRRHSVELVILDEKDQRPYKCVLKKDRPLLPRPRFS